MSSCADQCDEISGDVYGFNLLLTTLLSHPSLGRETCGKKRLSEKKSKQESLASVVVIRSSVMSLSQIRLAESGVDSHHV